MNQSPFARFVVALIAVASPLAAQTAPPSRDVPSVDVNNLHDVIAHHPASVALSKIFPDSPAAAPADFKSSGLTRKDYLPLMAGNVDFWKHFLSPEGAIVDPYEKKERQYATPAFALSAALLVQEADRKDLLEPATRALSFSIAALANKTTADGHADFYIPMVIHARRILKDKVAADVLAKWDTQLKSLIPEKTYHDIVAHGNWNLVNVSGELMRRKDGLVADDQMAAQETYLERCLKTQLAQFTKFGMYEDPNAPLAYDAFPRLWAEDALADGVIPQSFQDIYSRNLTFGSLSGLLLLSSSGEWACGGRSAHHQWNEAENVEISEINAARWAQRGRGDLAGAFKRAAHLALTSMKRWQRVSGEMWVVKNFADPARRFGYEGYSFHSQYNLLAMGMLAIAYERADESIAEFPIPSERSTYVFDLRDFYHHIVAAAGGTYVLIDTSADPHYGATGLQRIHKSGVALSPLTDSAAAERAFGPADDKIKVGLAPGIQWKTGEAWHSLGDYGIHQHQNAPSKRDTPPPPAEKNYMDHVDVKMGDAAADRAAFTITYTPTGDGARVVEESYVVSAAGVEITTRLAGDDAPGATRYAFPALVNDGARMTEVALAGNKLSVRRVGGGLTCEIVSPAGAEFRATGPFIMTHNGFVQAIAADLPAGTREVKCKIAVVP